MERKSIGLGIYFMLSGFLISLWKGSKVMGNGRYFAPMRLQVWLIVGEKSLRNHTLNRKEGARQRRLSRHRISMLFKDTCNTKSNQQNLGTIKSSNLCTEIIEYTSPTESAVCNLASIALPICQREGGSNGVTSF